MVLNCNYMYMYNVRVIESIFINNNFFITGSFLLNFIAIKYMYCRLCIEMEFNS